MRLGDRVLRQDVEPGLLRRAIHPSGWPCKLQPDSVVLAECVVG